MSSTAILNPVKFLNNTPMKDVREKTIYPLIDQQEALKQGVAALDTALHNVTEEVHKSFVDCRVDSLNKTLTFVQNDSTLHTPCDLSPMFDGQSIDPTLLQRVDANVNKLLSSVTPIYKNIDPSISHPMQGKGSWKDITKFTPPSSWSLVEGTLGAYDVNLTPPNTSREFVSIAKDYVPRMIHNVFRVSADILAEKAGIYKPEYSMFVYYPEKIEDNVLSSWARPRSGVKNRLSFISECSGHTTHGGGAFKVGFEDKTRFSNLKIEVWEEDFSTVSKNVSLSLENTSPTNIRFSKNDYSDLLETQFGDVKIEFDLRLMSNTKKVHGVLFTFLRVNKNNEYSSFKSAQPFESVVIKLTGFPDISITRKCGDYGRPDWHCDTSAFTEEMYNKIYSLCSSGSPPTCTMSYQDYTI